MFGLLGTARQKIENPVSNGKIHCGKSSQMKMLLCLCEVGANLRCTVDLRSEDHVENLEFAACSCPVLEESIEHGDKRQDNGVKHFGGVEQSRYLCCGLEI
jgi:hypothetical protein